MSVILDTGIVPAADRAELIRETISRAFVRVDFSFAEGLGPAAAVGSITNFGDLTCTPPVDHGLQDRFIGPQQ
jgi:hypothetical protein